MKLLLPLLLFVFLAGCDKPLKVRVVQPDEPDTVNEYSGLAFLRDGLYYLPHSVEPVTGIVREWRDDGQLHKEATYVEGKKHGLSRDWEWWECYYKSAYSCAYLEEETQWLDGEKNGLYRSWYKNGQQKSEENYVDGKRDGLYQKWYGQLKRAANIVNGKIEGLAREWDYKGVLTTNDCYSAGKAAYMSHCEAMQE